ncbi:MAG: FIST C-terminal domain-containing protein [Alphaproteobacteria bacterium]|nr:FIST C-terminal domain-containing protein [Alphaproteobacteria bacterium]MCB9694213.1 FIST C-terminal domain-containing protein [Alphaproteobacteria bacterium]
MAAGVGHSTQQMSREAGREAATVALEAARARHGGDLPPLTLVVVYATVLHDQAHVLDGVRSVLGEEAPLVGCSTQGISVRCGVHEVDRVVGCAVLAEPGIQAKPVRVEGLGADSRAAGRAVAAALGGPSDLPVLLWYDALTVNSTELLHGLAEGGVRWAIGGAAGQPFGQVHKTFQYLGGSVSEDSVVALALSGDVEMLYDQTHGAEPLGLELEVTASTQNVLGEVDGMPALDFLIDQLGIGDDELNIESASVWAIGVQPEAPADGDERGRLYEGPLTRAFFGWDLEQRTLSMQAEIPVGTRIQLCHRSHEAVLQGAVDMARRLNARVKGEPLLALGFECAARPRPFLGDDGAQEEICTMQAELVEMPWLGFYAWGEIAPAGARTESHNYTFPLVLLTRPSPGS